MNALNIITETFLGKKKDSKLKTVKLGRGKEKTTKKISLEQDLLNVIRSSNSSAGSKTQVLKILENKGKVLGDQEQANFYARISDLSYNVSKVSVTDILGGKKLNTVLQIGDLIDFKKKCFTNDKLYWISNIVHQAPNFDIISQYADLSNIKVSIATVGEQNKGYKEGYIQDYDKNFTFIGKDFIKDSGITKIMECITKKTNGKLDVNDTEFKEAFQIKYKEFVYNNIKYGSVSINDSDIILTFKEGTNIKETIENTSIFSLPDIKKIKSTLDIKKSNDQGGGIYLSQGIKLTDFAPNIVYLTSTSFMKSQVLIEYDIDLVLFEEYARKRYVSESGKKAEEGKISIDNLGDYLGDIELDIKDINIIYIFFLIKYITVFKEMSGTFAKNLKEFLDKFGEMKDQIIDAERGFSLVFNVIEKFYDCFKSKINFDPIKALYNYLLKVTVEIKDFLTVFGFYKVKSFLEDYGLNKIFKKFIKAIDSKDFLLQLFDRIYEITQMFNTLTDSPDLIKHIRATGVNCYKIFYNNKDSSSLGLVWKIRSPSSFLGSLIGERGLKLDFDLSKSIDRAKDKYVKTKTEEQSIIKSYASMLSKDVLDKSEDAMLNSLAEIIYLYGHDDDVTRTIYDKESLSLFFKQWAKTIDSMPEDFKKYLYLYSVVGKSLSGNKNAIPELIEKDIPTYTKLYKSYLDKLKGEEAVKLAEMREKVVEAEKKLEDAKEGEDVDIASLASVASSSTKATTAADAIKELKNNIRVNVPTDDQVRLGFKIFSDEELNALAEGERNKVLQLREIGVFDQDMIDQMGGSGKLAFNKNSILRLVNGTVERINKIVRSKDNTRKNILKEHGKAELIK